MDISGYLKSLVPIEDEPLIFSPNPGNGGDALIAEATFQLLRRHGIPFMTLTCDFDLEGKVVVFGGGGNLTPDYGDCRNFIMSHHQKPKKLVILPHTVKGNEDLLGDLGGNVDIICRESVSYEHVGRHARKANVMLADDLAFGLDSEGLLRNRAGNALPIDRSSLRQTLRMLNRLGKSRLALARKRLSNTLRAKGKDSRVLNCFREDVERLPGAPPEGNIDVSRMIPFKYTRSRGVERWARVVSYTILRFLSDFEEIRTNRLHICIAGALLGKRVHFYPNSYWKNRAVYEYSIKGKYGNVQWMEG
jgi:exopolysaccharide biosynthesis predicted pyruvyltransferase EpsI